MSNNYKINFSSQILRAVKEINKEGGVTVNQIAEVVQNKAHDIKCIKKAIKIAVKKKLIYEQNGLYSTKKFQNPCKYKSVKNNLTERKLKISKSSKNTKLSNKTAVTSFTRYKTVSNCIKKALRIAVQKKLITEQNGLYFIVFNKVTQNKFQINN
uniref:Uncharacterized protein n=1 Tax=Clastoptera arizonana TaxID=38151 RepID=A0A1B6C882_9HEMI